MFEDIKIPAEILPQDGRFGCGPSLVRPEFLEQLVKEQKDYLGHSHRKSAVKDMVGSVQTKVKSFLHVPDDYEIAMGNGSASLVWDMCTFSLTEKKSAHFVNGEFSSKWFQSADKSGFVEAKAIKVENGELPVFEEQADCDLHCITLNETSTGAMFPEAPKCKNSLLAVDGTSAVGAINWNMANCDLVFFSPQKAFGADGGLWIGAFSPRCIEQIARVKESGRYIPAMLDFATALNNAKSNQTYNTPALTNLYLIDKQLDWFKSNGGLEAMDKLQRDKNAVLTKWVDSRPELSFYVKDTSARSLTVSTINIQDDIPYADLTKQLRKHKIVDIDCYRKLGKNQIRISMFPNVPIEELEKLTLSINYLLDHR